MRWGLLGRWTLSVPFPGSGEAVLVPSITVGTGRGAGSPWTQAAWSSSSTLGKAENCKTLPCLLVFSSCFEEAEVWEGWLQDELSPKTWERRNCGFRVFLFLLLSCRGTRCCVCLQVCAAHARHSPGFWFGFFFCISSCKRDVRKTICSPKISSGADLLCFLYQIGSAWAGAVGCWAVLCSCLLVWCTEISLITSFLSWIIFGVHSTCVKWVLEMFVWWKKHLLFLCFLPFRSFKCSYPHHLTGSGNSFEVCSLVNSWK